MNTQHPLTSTSYKMLKVSLERFGNKLNVQHMMSLFSLLDTTTKMAEGNITGRWAFGLPTGTGKTRAIIEWSTAVAKLKLPYTLAVSASRIEALYTLKREMIENGVNFGYTIRCTPYVCLQDLSTDRMDVNRSY